MYTLKSENNGFTETKTHENKVIFYDTEEKAKEFCDEKFYIIEKWNAEMLNDYIEAICE